MYCKKCGNIIDDDSVFCTSCGAKQNSEKTRGNISSNKTPPIDVNIRLKAPKIKLPKLIKPEIKEPDVYDYSHKVPDSITYFGILFFIAYLLLFFILNGVSIEDNETVFLLKFLLYSNIALRIFAVFCVRKVAIHLNRNYIDWTTLAVFLPILSMILIGLQKRFRDD